MTRLAATRHTLPASGLAVPSAARVPVLMYHRVDVSGAPGDPGCVSPQRFGEHLAWLAEHGYQPCRIEDFVAWATGRADLPLGSLLITFDDGYAGLDAHVGPRLAEYGWPATVFLVSGRLGSRNDWDRAPASAAEAPLLDRAQVDRLARRGLQFHSHSATHADLTTLGDIGLHDEVAGSRQQLQRLLGHDVTCFAYPYGRCNDAVRAAVAAAGYTLAFGVQSGFNRPREDAWSIRRLDITANDSARRFGTKVSLGTNDGSLATRLRYAVGRLGWTLPS